MILARDPCNTQYCWRYLVDKPKEHKEWVLKKWVWAEANCQRKHLPGARRLKPTDLTTMAHQNLISLCPEVLSCSEYQSHPTHTVSMGDLRHSHRNLGDFSVLWSFRKSKSGRRGWAPTQSKTNVTFSQVSLGLCPVVTLKISEVWDAAAPLSFCCTLGCPHSDLNSVLKEVNHKGPDLSQILYLLSGLGLSEVYWAWYLAGWDHSSRSGVCRPFRAPPVIFTSLLQLALRRFFFFVDIQ